MTSHLLALPVELRLQIITYALPSPQYTTISTGALTGPAHSIVHRIYTGPAPLPYLPPKHESIISPTYDPTLLSLISPPTILAESLDDRPHSYNYTAQLSLSLTCKLLREDVQNHLALPPPKERALFVSYPNGLSVLSALVPQLVRQASRIALSGIYEPSTFSATHAANLPPFSSSASTSEKESDLSALLCSTFGPPPLLHPTCTSIELRIYYPGPDSYSTVWGDDSSPIVVALKNIYAGEVGIEVWRGRRGTGVVLRVKREGEGDGDRRVVSTVWRRLEETRSGRGGGRVVDQDGLGVGSDFVIDKAWPEAREGDGGRGDVVVDG